MPRRRPQPITWCPTRSPPRAPRSTSSIIGSRPRAGPRIRATSRLPASTPTISSGSPTVSPRVATATTERRSTITAAGERGRISVSWRPSSAMTAIRCWQKATSTAWRMEAAKRSLALLPISSTRSFRTHIRNPTRACPACCSWMQMATTITIRRRTSRLTTRMLTASCSMTGRQWTAPALRIVRRACSSPLTQLSRYLRRRASTAAVRSKVRWAPAASTTILV